MNDTLKKLYAKFINSTKEKVSYSTFCRYKPRNVVVPKLNDRDTCMCLKHENFKLLVSKLYKEKIIDASSSSILINSITCEEMGADCLMRQCDLCHEKQITFKSYSQRDYLSFKMWINKEEERLIKGEKKKIKRIVKEDITRPIGEITNKLKDDALVYMKHINNMQHQFKINKELRIRPENEMTINIDFSENYNCKYWSEPQSVHFGASSQQLSLHTGVAYSNGNISSFATVSDNLRHDAKAVAAHIKPVLSYLLERFPEVDCLNFISDGPTGQYRNRTMFTVIGKIIPQLFPVVQKITWNFSEAGHGKGSADGIGGALKRKADRLVSHKRDIHDLNSFVEAMRNEESSIKLIVIEDQDMTFMDSLVQDSCLIPTVKKTMMIHQVTWSNTSKSLHFNSLSCLQCAPGTYCSHYTIGPCVYLENEVHEEPSEEVQELEEIHERQAFEGPKVNEGDWVAVVYERDWYPGIVEKSIEDTIIVNFLARSGKNSFYWPNRPDRQTVSHGGILYKLKKAPTPVSNRILAIEEYKYIDFLSKDI